MESASVGVAAIQFASEFGAPERNRPRLADYAREAAARGARIVVFPEAAVHGYAGEALDRVWHAPGWPLDDGLEGVSPVGVAERVPGPSTEYFAALARELGIYLTVPLVESTPRGEFFNTVAVLDPDGDLALHYRKRNPWPHAERSWATPGAFGVPWIDTPFGRLAALICYDVNFELPRLARAGVDTVLYSIGWVEQPGSFWFASKLPSLAAEHGMNIVGANWTVREPHAWRGYGQSVILDATGRPLVRAREGWDEEVLVARLPPRA